MELVDNEDVNTMAYVHTKYEDLYATELYDELECNNVEVEVDIQWTSLADVVIDATPVN